MGVVVAEHVIMALGVADNHAQMKMKMDQAQVGNNNGGATFATCELTQFRPYLTQTVMVELDVLFLSKLQLAVSFSLLG